MMRESLRHWGTVLFAVSLGAAVLTGCGSDEPDTVEATFTMPRTYEQLDLASPEATVDEFISAFVRRDYVTAALILHPDTQRTMAAAIAAGDLSGLVTSGLEAAVVARIAVEQGGDHVLEAGRVFEIAMEEAMANGGFHVDLASGADGLTLRSSDQFTAVVDGILATNGNDVVFELAPTTDGRWRIRSVRLANGLPSQIPFSGTPSVMAPERRIESTDVWRSTLPNSDPQELLQTVAALIGSGDHVSLYLLLDTTAQQAVVDRLASEPDPNHGLVASRLDARLDTVGFAVDLAGLGAVPSDIMTTSLQVGPGEALTFLVPLGDDGLDVTLSRDSTGGWRLRRMVPIGDITAPSPFVIG